MIDARGLSCPMPVVMAQKALKVEHPDTLEVLVDARVAVENITRMAHANGYEIAAEETGEEFRLTLTKR